MNTKHLSLLAAAVVAVLSSGSVLAANIVGSQTVPANTSGPSVNVGESDVEIPDTPHKKGRAGIGVSDFENGARVDFIGLAANADSSDDLGNGLTHYKLSNYPHPAFGKFDFVQVANADVWFGTWSENADGSGNYQAYYVGDNTGTTLPAAQTATYTVAGLNGSNVLTGTLTANFGGDNTLTGALFNSSLTVDIVAAINSSDASFSGAALANTGDGFVDGSTNGHFFGANAASLAGIAEFASDTSLNTAFGGTKNP